MERKQFTFYRSFYEALMTIPEEQRLGALMALIEYALELKKPEDLTDQQKTYYIMAKPNLDAAWEKALGGQAGKRGPAQKNNKGKKKNKKEKKKEKEIEIETETETEAEGFLRFWQRYPVKLGRQEALAQWESVCDEFDEKDILKGLEAWRKSDSWRREDGRFIPKAEKWLRENWWLQNPKQPVPTGASGTLGQAELEAIQRMLEE